MVRKLAVCMGAALAAGCAVRPPLSPASIVTTRSVQALNAMPMRGSSVAKASVRLISPVAGSTVTSTNIPIKLAISNFRIEAADVGQPAKPGQGHIHVMLDKPDMAHLTNVEMIDHFTISGLGIKPGPHTLYVELAGDDHRTLVKPIAVKFYYEPTEVLSLPKARALGAPEVSIVSPADGATVPRNFVLQVSTKNIDLSCAAEGRANVEGLGHLHVFASQAGITDRPSALGRDPMAMVGMLSMPCSDTVPVDLSGWHSGPVTLTVMLAKNDHMAMDVPPAKVTVNLR